MLIIRLFCYQLRDDLALSEVVKDHAKNKIKLINKENSNWAFFVIFSQSVIPMMMMHTAAF